MLNNLVKVVRTLKRLNLFLVGGGGHLNPDIPCDLDQCGLGLGGKLARNFSLSRWDSGRMVKLGLRKSTEPA